MEEAQTPNSQSEQAYRALQRLLSRHTAESPVESYVRAIEATNRVHLALMHQRSELSYGYRLQGVKRRLAEIQARDPPRDKRFVKGFGLARMRELTPSFKLFLFPTHFKLDHFPEGFSYTGPMKFLLDAVGTQTILPEMLDLMDELNAPFYDGCVLVEISDHRTFIHRGPSTAGMVVPQFESYRVLLHPTPESVMIDMNRLQDNYRLTDEQVLDLESQFLRVTEPICLDPSPRVAVIGNIIDYNRKKHRHLGRQRFKGDVKHQNLSEMETLMHLAPHSKLQSPSNFKQIAFIEGWRKNKSESDHHQMQVLDRPDRTMTRNSPKYGLQQLIRSIKYARSSQPPVYTTLNIFLCADGTFEMMLRWGSQPDTSVNGRVYEFQLPNLPAVEYYIHTFTNAYANWENHKLVEDVMANVDLSKVVLQLQQQQPHKQFGEVNLTGVSSVPVPPPLTKTSASRSRSSVTAPAPAPAPQPPKISAPTSVAASAIPSASHSPASVTIRQINSAQMKQVEERLARQNAAAVAAISTTQASATSQVSPTSTSAASPAQANVNPPAMSPSLIQESPQQAAQQNAALLLALQQQAKQFSQEQLHKLLTTPFEQVPEEHRQVYQYIRYQLKKRRAAQLQEAALQQAAAARSQSPLPVQQPNATQQPVAAPQSTGIPASQVQNPQVPQVAGLNASQLTPAQQQFLRQRQQQILAQQQALAAAQQQAQLSGGNLSIANNPAALQQAQAMLNLQQLQLNALRSQQQSLQNPQLQRSFSQPQINPNSTAAAAAANLQQMQQLGLLNPNLLGGMNAQINPAALNLAQLNMQQGGITAQNLQAFLRQQQQQNQQNQQQRK